MISGGEARRRARLPRNLREQHTGCGFGSEGLCCFLCAGGPCRINPYAAGYVPPKPCPVAGDLALIGLGSYLANLMLSAAAALTWEEDMPCRWRDASGAGASEARASGVARGSAVGGSPEAVLDDFARGCGRVAVALAKVRSGKAEALQDALDAGCDLAAVAAMGFVKAEGGLKKVVLRRAEEREPVGEGSLGEGQCALAAVPWKAVEATAEGSRVFEVPALYLPALAVGLAACGLEVACAGWRPGGRGRSGDMLSWMLAKRLELRGGRIDFLDEV